MSIAVPELATGSKIFRDKLGFTVVPEARFAEGVESASIRFETGTHIELLSFFGPGQRQGVAAAMERKIPRGGGPVFYAIDASPLEQTAEIAQKAGVLMRGPAANGKIIRNGEETQAPWRSVRLNQGFLPGPVSFIEYSDNNVRRDVRANEGSAGTGHTNTARRLASVWFAVEDIKNTTRNFDLLGFKTLSSQDSQLLNAKGLEIQCGQGTVTLWEPIGGKGPVAEALAREDGCFGWTVEVKQLSKARDFIQRANSKSRVLSVDQRQSFVVGPEVVPGSWAEFIQVA